MRDLSPAVNTDAKVCPYCGKTLGVTATVCRFCGRDLLAPIEPLQHGPSVWVVEQKKSSGVDVYLKGLGVLGLVAMSILGLVAVACMVSAVLAFMPHSTNKTLTARTDTLASVVLLQPTAADNIIVLGQTVVMPDIAEATLDKVYFAKKVVPPNPAKLLSVLRSQRARHHIPGHSSSL